MCFFTNGTFNPPTFTAPNLCPIPCGALALRGLHPADGWQCLVEVGFWQGCNWVKHEPRLPRLQQVLNFQTLLQDAEADFWKQCANLHHNIHVRQRLKAFERASRLLGMLSKLAILVCFEFQQQHKKQQNCMGHPHPFSPPLSPSAILCEASLNTKNSCSKVSNTVIASNQPNL